MTLLERMKNILKIDKKEKLAFPCAGCIILAKGGCREICDKVETDKKKMLELFMEFKCCIDCGSHELYEGPSGGLSQNVECVKCGHKFNLAVPLLVERI